ncbi:MAG TPA: MauE/DoxX family redox-associated membrane protein [Jatrophihabitans sp.]|nr:MauE/DoxX family redox-associated membrane protein [Jatrophihabitans sp.]
MLSSDLLMFCRWSIGLTFAVSAIGKARDLRGFELAVTELRALPAGLARPAALATVLAEALVVLALAVGRLALPIGFGLAAGLLLLFSVVLAAALRRRTTVSCNCFGASERPISGYDLIRNGALLACCAAGLAGYASTDRQPPAEVIVLLGLMAGCFALIVTNAEDIVELLRKPYLVE